MARWICEVCSGEFFRDKSGQRPIRFCGADCYHAWQRSTVTMGRFKKGRQTWNKGVRGLHFSPDTEFKKGRKSSNKLSVGSETIRTDKNGKHRAFVKVAEPNSWLERAIVVWEKHHGHQVPEGMVIHHRDRNSINDAPDNLQMLTRAEHIEEHRDDLLAAKRAA